MAEEVDPLLDPETPRLGGEVVLLGPPPRDLEPPVDVGTQPGKGLEEQVWSLPGLEAADIEKLQRPTPAIRVRSGVATRTRSGRAPSPMT